MEKFTDFKLPIHISNDSDYLSSLKRIFRDYVEIMNKEKSSVIDIGKIEEIADSIIQTLDYYY